MTKNILQNNSWHVNNESDTVFVFIHGFFSNSQKCWTSECGIRWPDLISLDVRLGNPDIYLAGFYTAVDSSTYRISDCSKDVYESLCLVGKAGEAAPITRQNIVFICHSLGGIVARYLIERNREKFQDKAVGLILLASPSYGSDYASGLLGIIDFYRNDLARELTTANASLQDLDDRFKALVENRLIPGLVGAEGVEHRFPLHFKYLPGFAPLVSKESASRYFGASRTLSNTNHSTCVKPTSLDHVSHIFLVSTYLQKFVNLMKVPLLAITSKGHTSVVKDKPHLPSPLFEVYDPVHEPYYVVRQTDMQVFTGLEVFSLWVFGASGVGKTAAIRRHIIPSSPSAIHVYVGGAIDISAGHLGLLKEIYYTVLSVVEGEIKELSSSNQILNEISALLVRHVSRHAVALFIDEVPLLANPNVELTKFMLAINGLILLINQICGGERLSIVITSIFDPRSYLVGNGRAREQIRFLLFDRWTEVEINELIDRIESSSSDLTVAKYCRADLVSAANGSPRFVKTFYKSLLMTKERSNTEIKSVLRQTQIAMNTDSQWIPGLEKEPK